MSCSTIDVQFSQMIFSPCGRYIYGVSNYHLSAVTQFDTWKCRVVRTIKDPFSCGPLGCMTLSIWNVDGDVLLTGCVSQLVLAVHLPFNNYGGICKTAPENEKLGKKVKKYERAYLAVAPRSTEEGCTLNVLWPKNTSGEIRIIGQGPNYIRKGDNVSNLEWPFVLCVKEEDVGEWEELELAEDGVICEP